MSGRRIGIASVVVAVMVITFGLCCSGEGLAGSPASKQVNLYFHGMDLADKLGDHVAKVTVKYDGKSVCENKHFSSRSGWGGITTGRVSYSAYIEVHIRILDKSGSQVAEKRWDKKFGDGTYEFFLKGKPGYWAFYMYMKRNGTDVEVKLG